MHSLLPVVLSCLLLAFSAGVKADVYSDVNRLVVSEQWAKAQTQAEQHLKSQPTDPQMRLLLSRIQDGLGQTAAAMETLQALTQSFPELPEPHNNLAALLALDLQPFCRQAINVVEFGGTEVAAGRLMNIGPKDLLIAISFPRYASDAVMLTRYARDRCAHVIALTDSMASPLTAWCWIKPV